MTIETYMICTRINASAPWSFAGLHVDYANATLVALMILKGQRSKDWGDAAEVIVIDSEGANPDHMHAIFPAAA